jgi:hypothetical protein
MCPADPQPQYRNQDVLPEEFAALIDGEITDMNRIEQLKSMLQGDTSLSVDYDAQREIKLLLAGLPEAEAPSFMQTRIMGEISSRKRQRHSVWLPKWGAAAAAVAVFGMGYGAALQFASQQAGNVHLIAEKSAQDPATFNAQGVTAALPQPSLNAINVSTALPDGQAQFASDLNANVTAGQDYFQNVYAASASVDIPEDADPWLREFIELGNEAHNYSRAMRLTHNLAAPDVSQAVMVVDSR